MADIDGRFGHGGGDGIPWMNTLSVRVKYVACILVWMSMILRKSGNRMNMAQDVPWFVSAKPVLYNLDHVVYSTGAASILKIAEHV